MSVYSRGIHTFIQEFTFIRVLNELKYDSTPK